ncbi:MAG: CrcB family protein [Bacillaceae bacterium]|nr:CrcB family protein [Bacillaceae bacterium]
MKGLVAVGAGGFVGAVIRYLVDLWLSTAYWPTILVNVTGSLGLSMAMVYFLKRKADPGWVQLFVTAGFFGSFTTFSTFSGEAFELLRQGELTFFLAYQFSNVVTGLLMAWLGVRGYHLMDKESGE